MAPSTAFLAFLLPTLIHALNTQSPITLLLPPPLRPDQTCISPLTPDDLTPWTHPPYCLKPRSIGSSDTYCVYTSSVFNNGAGISIITTPPVAAALGSSILDPQPASLTRQHLATAGHLTPSQDAQNPYKIVSLPGKGKGAIATRNIRKFDIIMVSYPNMVVDNTFLPRQEDEAPVEGWRMFQKALDQLGDKRRFTNLAGSREGVHVVEDVVRTNAFGVHVDGRDLKALFPEISRFNHACKPNTHPQYRSRDMAMTAVATRDIDEGEEITISYLPLGMPSFHRKANLVNWGFDCTCDLCTSSPEELHASDMRREKLADLYFGMKEDSVTHQQLGEMIREFDSVVEQEGLETRNGEYYISFMHFYHKFGDLDNALKYAKLSLQTSEAFADPDGNFCEGLRQDIDFLEKEIAKKRGTTK